MFRNEMLRDCTSKVPEPGKTDLHDDLRNVIDLQGLLPQ